MIEKLEYTLANPVTSRLVRRAQRGALHRMLNPFRQTFRV